MTDDIVKNYYRYVERKVDLPFFKGESCTSYMIELQHKVYQDLWRLKKTGRYEHSPFLNTLHANFRSTTSVVKKNNSSNNYIQRRIDLIQSISNGSEIADVLSALHADGVFCLFEVDYDPDLLDANTNIIYLKTYHNSFFDTDLCLQDYAQALFRCFRLTPPRYSVTRFHKRLLKHSPNLLEVQEVKKCYNPLRANELSPDLVYLKYYFQAASVLTGQTRVQVDKFSVDSVKYFSYLGRCLKQKKWLNQWKEYLTFAYLHHVGQFFSNTYRLEHKYVNVKDTKHFYTLPFYLTQFASDAWWKDSSHVFVDAFRPYFQKIRKLVCHVAEDVKTVLRNAMGYSVWSRETKIEALRKLNDMIFLIGWGEEENKSYRKPKAKKEAFQHFDVGVLTGYRANYKHVFEAYQTRVYRECWRYLGIQEVNAFYSRELNVMYIPCSLFYKPFVLDNMAQTYASIGNIVAHEMFHGFDSQSRLVDSNRELSMWWSKRDFQQYNVEKRKTERLYSRRQSISGNVRVNGKLTITENIADIMALRLSWQAFLMRVLVSNDDEKVVVSVQDAKDFFTMFAASQVVKYPSHLIEEEEKLDQSDNHSPAEARVNLPLSIFGPFLRLYHVHKSDPMFTPVAQRPDFLPISDLNI